MLLARVLTRIDLADQGFGHAGHRVALPEAAEHGLAGVRRVLPDDALGRPERFRGGARHTPQHLVVVDTAGYRASGLQQRLELPGLAPASVPPGRAA